MSRGSVMGPPKRPLPVTALASCSSPSPKSTERVTLAPSGQPLPLTVTSPPAAATGGVNCIAGAPPLGSSVAVGVTAVVGVGVVAGGAGSDGATVGVSVGTGVWVAVGASVGTGVSVAVGVSGGTGVCRAVGRGGGVAVGGAPVA